MRIPTDTGRLVLDALQLMLCGPMSKSAPGSLSMLKQETPFIKSSFEEHSSKLLQDNLLARLKNFDIKNVNEETLELLEPYFNV